VDPATPPLRDPAGAQAEPTSKGAAKRRRRRRLQRAPAKPQAAPLSAGKGAAKPPHSSGDPQQKPQQKRVLLAMKAKWGGVPNREDVPTKILCREVDKWFEDEAKRLAVQYVKISDSTIKRAAGRKK
jgi:hypothetical protein